MNTEKNLASNNDHPSEIQDVVKNQKGQSFIEFILILVILITLSFGFMRGFRFLIGTRWMIMLQIITSPNPPGDINF